MLLQNKIIQMNEKLISKSVLIILLVLSSWIIWPGLSGPFLFDDFGNLNKLGQYGGVKDWQTFRVYLFGGIAGPGGRPISLLSFLLNASDWPTDPWPFKLTNLLLHLLTGALLYFLIHKIVRFRGYTDPAAIWMAALATAFWLLNPFFISTTLYVVQRMAILVALFVALGLLLYLHGREQLDHAPRRGYLWMSLAITVCTPLAFFSKENGALLPLLALVVEWTVLRDAPQRPVLDRRWQAIFLLLPVLLMVGYFTVRWPGWLAGYETRPFSFSERLLTESRILFDYLHQLLLPRLNAVGLFNENYLLSQGLLQPPTTLFSIIGLAVLIIGAVVLRRKLPLLSLSILFFFAGHLLESSFIPLELYFEHRNYLPAFFLFLPIAQMVVTQAPRYRLLPIGALLGVALFGFLTHQQALLWSDRTALILNWAAQNPTSMRAQRSVAIEWEQRGRADLALRQLREASHLIPDNVELLIHRLTLECRYAVITPQMLADADNLIRRSPYEFRTFNLLEALFSQVVAGACNGIDMKQAHQLLVAMTDNPVTHLSTGPLAQIHYLHGLLYVNENQPPMALHAFQQAFRARSTPDIGMMAVALLASHKMYDEALVQLQEVKNSIANRPAKLGELDFRQEIDRVEANIRQEQISHPSP